MQIRKVLTKIKLRGKNLLGLDIRTNALRMVELSYVNSQYQVEAWVNLPLDSPIFIHTILAVMNKAYVEQPFKTRDVALAMAHSNVIFKEFKIEQGLSEQEIERFLQYSIKKQVGAVANHINFDYQIIKPYPKTDDYAMLCLIAVQRELIDNQLKLMQAANLNLKIVDTTANVLERVVRRQITDIANLVAIINIDNNAILIVVIDNQRIVYAHEDVVVEIPTQSPIQIVEVLVLKVQPIFSMMQQPIEQLVLAGVGAMAVGLVVAVQEKFNIPTIVIDPFRQMNLSLHNISREAPAMALSCGLALRAADACGN